MKYQKFIKITTKTSDQDLIDLFSTLSTVEINDIDRFYRKFSYVEYYDEVGYKCMCASIHENYIKDLLDMYVRFSIPFEFQDMSKEVLYGFVKFEIESLNDLADKYIDNNLDTDSVLDKILEFGSSTLTKKDISVLEKH